MMEYSLGVFAGSLILLAILIALMIHLDRK